MESKIQITNNFLKINKNITGKKNKIENNLIFSDDIRGIAMKKKISGTLGRTKGE